MSTTTPEKTTAESAVFPVAGILAVDDNNAFVRVSGYLPSPGDIQVPLAMVRKHRLRAGDDILGTARAPRGGGNRNARPVLATVQTMPNRPVFNDLTPVNPNERLMLGPDPVGRIIDLVTPIGKGQRGLIVAPPKAGKTMILQSLARSIATNHPECHLMLLLVDERPEEVTDLRKSVPGAEVVWSTFDRPPAEHIAVADLAVERAKRLAEQGHDVVILLDSLTRLGRAHNLAAPNSSRILAGGVAATALYPPKKFFGAARNLEEAGSLTIIATALVETGSRMDEVFFEEFKGTGNMELRLSRKLAERRLFPAIDLAASSTRRDELIVPADELARTWRLRSMLDALGDTQALELLLAKVKETRANATFLAELP